MKDNCHGDSSVGKPFESELDAFCEVYAWAMTAPLDTLVDNIRASAQLPLIAVGSGGSFSAAQLVAGLHSYACGTLSYAATPMQMAHDVDQVSNTAIHILSARGSNVDVLAAIGHAITTEPATLLLTTAVRHSRAAAMLPSSAHLTEFELPIGRDGFLATNSLLALATLFARAYLSVGGYAGPALPGRIDELLRESPRELRARLCHDASPLLMRDTTLVLHCPTTRAAAFDLESKFSEAALGNVLLSDFRNFAHGRHHWLAKRASSSCIVALADTANETLATRTLLAVPSAIPRALYVFKGDYAASALAALVTSIFIAEAAGKARGIDPGRPGVPSFGRRIYHLRPTKVQRSPTISIQMAVQRKTGHTWSHLARTGASRPWKHAHQQFTSRLASTRFGAIVLDYDGTMCDATHRFGSMDSEVAVRLNRLLSSGILVGIATGRGKSVRAAAQALIDRSFWPRVWIGYYNCSDIGRLDDDMRPAVTPIDPRLQEVYKRVTTDPSLVLAKVTLRPSQLTVEAPDLDPATLWDRLPLHLGETGARVVSSSHSIDVLSPTVTKLALITHLRPGLAPSHDVLCIGDRGRWPGNDHELLSTPYSLSVDEVSPDPDSCWNLLPPAVRGPAGTCYYFSLLKISSEGLRFQKMDFRHA
jgi:hypothetical protein